MKKAKIMLTAVAVLAVVGGALAFKATTTTAFLCYNPTTAGQNAACTLADVATITDPNPAAFTAYISDGLVFTTSQGDASQITCPENQCGDLESITQVGEF